MVVLGTNVCIIAKSANIFAEVNQCQEQVSAHIIYGGKDTKYIKV